MIFVDPEAISFQTWEHQLASGFVFDYLEGRLWVTVEVVRIEPGAIVQLDLRIVDDTFSRRPKPARGDVIHVAYRKGTPPAFTWSAHARGYFARHAAYHRTADQLPPDLRPPGRR